MKTDISELIVSKKDLLIGKHTHKSFKKIIKDIFCRHRVRVNVYETFRYVDDLCMISMGGCYDDCCDKIDIDFYVSETPNSEIIIKLSFWKEFKFKLGQLMQHELIHRKQSHSREGLFEAKTYNVVKDDDGKREYFANSDEIGAYSHDIALEIMHFYKKIEKVKIFSKISKKKKLQSFIYYKEAFGNTDWTRIYRKLMKKTYKWVEYYDV